MMFMVNPGTRLKSGEVWKVSNMGTTARRQTFHSVPGIAETLVTRTLSPWLSPADHPPSQLTAHSVCGIRSGWSGRTVLYSPTGREHSQQLAEGLIHFLNIYSKAVFTIIQVS